MLITSYTHSAVDNLLLKLIEAGVPCLRVGKPASVHPGVRPHCINFEGEAETTAAYSELVASARSVPTGHVARCSLSLEKYRGIFPVDFLGVREGRRSREMLAVSLDNFSSACNLRTVHILFSLSRRGHTSERLWGVSRSAPRNSVRRFFHGGVVGILLKCHPTTRFFRVEVALARK